MDADRKRAREQEVVSCMIELYCRRKHHTKGTLCPECAALRDYAAARSAHCPFMGHKTFCSQCPVHCYKSEMRQKIRAVMRFSGPRMLLVHPLMALHHMAETLRSRLRKEKIS